MTAEAVQFLSGFLAQIWKYFVSWNIPGTNVTPIGWALFIALVMIFINTFKRLMVIPDASASGSSPKGGDSK